MVRGIYAVAVCFFGGLFLTSTLAFSHCQIPCGIYDDGAKFIELRQHADTIRKSVSVLLKNKNRKKFDQQLVREVINKENHANKIQQEVADYFLAQRIKVGENKDRYHNQLVAAHALSVAAMKTKQNATMKEVDSLDRAIESLHAAYGHK